MVAMLGASQNAKWLAAHTQHLLKPSFSFPQFVIPEVFKTISKMMLPAVQIDSPRSPKIQVAVGLRRSSGVYSNLVSRSRHWCSQGSSKPSAKVCSQGSKVIPGVAKTISIKEFPGIQIGASRCKESSKSTCDLHSMGLYSSNYTRSDNFE